MRYQITNGTVSLGGETILNHIDFEIRGNEKIAVVGRNGAGKTTLLKLIAGELSLDRDDKRFQPGIWMARNTTIGMLHQSLFGNLESTVEDEILSQISGEELYFRERYEFEQEYNRLFTGFGFAMEDRTKKLREFSGGEQTKLALIKLLLLKPDILLLDEPTNHLDMDVTAWLEEYLQSYEKAVVMVSHDRFFLDQTANVVYELSEGKLKRYAGNYTAYRIQREKDRQLQHKKYQAQQKEIQRLNELIERFKHKPKKASMARSKKKVLERMQKVDRPQKNGAHIFTDKIQPNVLGSKCVLDTDKLQIGYDRPLQEITLRVKRGQKIGILGVNGIGKTTFIKTITEQIPPVSGTFQLGNGIEIGYFDQHSAEMISDKRIFEHFHDLYPKLTMKEVKQALGNYLFRGDDAGKKITDLSGGEKSRLVLAELMEGRPNFLVLDEPTNHIDIPAKETLESAFGAYEGTILFISHDRYFIKEVADALLIFEENKVTYYPFGYEHYLESLRKKRECKENGINAVEAENTLLIHQLKAVPESKRMQSARFSTEQSYTDWQLELAGEQLDRIRFQIEKHLKEREDEAYWMSDAYHEKWNQRLTKLEEEYTNTCHLWYEKWQDYEQAFESYRD